MRLTMVLVAAALAAGGCQQAMNDFDRAMQGEPKAAATAPAPAPQEVVYSDPQVRDAQLGLQKLGYYRSRVDGVTGPKTRDAVRRFQSDLRREPDGVVDDEVIGLLVRYIEINPPVAGQPLIADVFEAQRGLKRLGLYSGVVNGLYDPATVRAVLRYRQEAGLPAGKDIDRALLRRLAADVAALPSSSSG